MYVLTMIDKWLFIATRTQESIENFSIEDTKLEDISYIHVALELFDRSLPLKHVGPRRCRECMIKRAQRRPYRARFEPGPGATVTKIYSGASFQLITEFNTSENYQPYGMYLVYIREAVHCRGHRTLAFYNVLGQCTLL